MSILALSLLAASLCPQSFQDSDVNELRFHRVFLTNGNFIDGELVKDTPSQVVLRLKSGEMGIRRDQVERVEFIKMKGRPDASIVVSAPKKEAPKPASPAAEPAAPSSKNPAIDKIPQEIRKRVDMMVYKLRTTPGFDKEFPHNELVALGDDGAVYLALRTPDIDPKLLTVLSAALINLKNPKVVPVMEGYLSHANPSVRAIAATVVGMLAEPADRGRILRPILRDADAGVRGTVLGLLGAVEEPEWLDPIGDMCTEKVREVRVQALSIATRLAIKHGLQDKFMRVLSGNLKDIDEGVRADNASAIGGLARREAWPALVGLFGDREPKVRSSAAQALLALAAPESANDIVAHMGREQDFWCRSFLAQAAQKLKADAAIDTLIEWLGDADDEVKKLAEATLRSLTGQGLGMDREKWTAWRAANK